MFEGIINRGTLLVAALLLHDIHEKLLKGENLTEGEEEILKLHLLGTDPRREFRDEKHRDKLLAQWWDGAKILDKRLKEEEEKDEKLK